MFISTAFAQAAGGAPDAGGTLISFLPLILIFVVFYFLLIRPQQKKMKEHQAMLAALRRGDRIVTGGGIIGTIAKTVGNDELIVEIAEGIRVRVLRSTVSAVLAKTEPARASATDENDAEEDETAPPAQAPAGEDAKGQARGVSRLLGRK